MLRRSVSAHFLSPEHHSIITAPLRQRNQILTKFLRPCSPPVSVRSTRERRRASHYLRAASLRRWSASRPRRTRVFLCSVCLWTPTTFRLCAGKTKQKKSGYWWDGLTEGAIFALKRLALLIWTPWAAGVLTDKSDQRESQCSWNFATIYVLGKTSNSLFFPFFATVLKRNDGYCFLPTACATVFSLRAFQNANYLVFMSRLLFFSR